MPSPGKVRLHFVFCTKYRLPFLTGGIAQDIEHFIRLKAEELKCEITAFSTQPDHVHLLVEMPHTISASKVAQAMKGRSSYEVRKRFLWLRQCRAFWQVRFFCCSVGPRSHSRVRRYLQNQ